MSPLSMLCGLTALVFAINRWPVASTIALALTWLAVLVLYAGGPRRPQH